MVGTSRKFFITRARTRKRISLRSVDCDRHTLRRPKAWWFPHLVSCATIATPLFPIAAPPPSPLPLESSRHLVTVTVTTVSLSVVSSKLSALEAGRERGLSDTLSLRSTCLTGVEGSDRTRCGGVWAARAGEAAAGC